MDERISGVNDLMSFFSAAFRLAYPCRVPAPQYSTSTPKVILNVRGARAQIQVHVL